ncbi:retropepsin-like aspartic protease family protein [Neptunicoccus sediminis]|uniref:retropepsin-like aspartic protease family protein n=1 Tax=Neptunicoccus sediminis TaxID=1892596 RepID=UPI000845BDF8|nr:TIGR02281 family clan AA aspartic protease [Neptunicoccus sediminis]
MRWVYLAIVAFLGIVFLRADVQLVDLVLDANLKWSAVAVIFLVGLVIGQILRNTPSRGNTLRYAGWGLFVTIILGLLEYSVEWQRDTLLARNETVILSAASLETVSQHYITARNGLYSTTVTFNEAESEALVDTGASLVLINYTTAQAAGVEMDTLVFDTRVTTASGPLDIALVTLDQVRLGDGISVRKVKAAVTPKGLRHSNLLGSSFLSKLDETVVRQDKMILTQTRR